MDLLSVIGEIGDRNLVVARGKRAKNSKINAAIAATEISFFILFIYKIPFV